MRSLFVIASERSERGNLSCCATSEIATSPAKCVAGLLAMTFSILLSCTFSYASSPSVGNYNKGIELYQAGRFSDAVDSFDQAIKHKEKVHEAQDYIDRIRKETVERIRNKALTGVNKSNWQSKYYFMNEVDGRVHVGISVQEVFERDSTNFRSGALDALHQLAIIFGKAETARFDIELINELSLDTPPDSTLTAQQLTAVFSYLSLDSRGSLPKS
jgi:hypothetical protein